MLTNQVTKFASVKFDVYRSWIGLIIVFVCCSILAGCASNAVVYSKKMVEAISPLDSFNVVYIERNLLSKSIINSDPVNADVAKFGYYDIGQSIVEFGPSVFKDNGFAANFSKAVMSELAAGKLSNYDKNSNTLSLEFQQGRIVTQGALKTVSLLLVANLYRKEGFARIWNGQFRIHLGHDPALGHAKTTRVDKEFIESLLVTVLTQLAIEELIVLKRGGVVTSSIKKSG